MSAPHRFEKVLVANRGEIAARVLRTCRDLGLATVAVYSDADADLPHVALADEAVRIGPAPAAESYLSVTAILDAARRTGAEAIHPGYGFLSENADFGAAVEAAGLVFIGPRPETARSMGDKAAARQLMAARGVPVVPGHDGPEQDDDRFAAEAARIGFPVLVKAAAGGGGKGMSIVEDAGALPAALAQARRLARSAFGDDRLLLERYLRGPRHVEVQILGDGRGGVVHCFERECSVQRRFQKIIEETPSPGLDAATRAALCAAGVAAGEAIAYRGAGTVEFILDASGAFYFLEVNTRLQVEHPVTEATTGLDLVAWQIRVARGEALPAQADIQTSGHAIECRLYAEDPARDSLPSTGRLALFEPPTGAGVRVDAGVVEGSEVGVFYDPLLAKIITSGDDRATAIDRMRGALRRLRVGGVTTNQALLLAIMRHPAFGAGATTTGFLGEHFAGWAPAADEAATTRRAAIAAVFLARARKAAAGHLPALRSGWRNVPFAGQREQLTHGDAVLALETLYRGDHAVVQVGGVAVTVRGPLDRPEVDGVRQACRVVEDADRLFVADASGVSAFGVVPLFPPPADEGPAGGCTAPMPGRVVAVHVTPGQDVEKGHVLVILEAMKMEQTLQAPHAGRVEAVHCAPGDLVDAGAVLITLAEAEAGPS